MNVKKCANGHFFDADKYQLCPHCGVAAENNDSVNASSERKHQSQPRKRRDEKADVVMKAMPQKTMGKTFGLFDEVTQEVPSGRVVKVVSAPSPSKKEEPVKSTQKCFACGKEISSTAHFCKYCGTPMKQNKVFSDSSQAASASAFAKEPVKTESATTQGSYVFNMASSASMPETKPAVKPVVEQVDKEPTLEEAVRSAVSGNEGRTIGFFSMGKSEDNRNDADPVVGWLVCVKGKHFGESFPIAAGRNSLGRGALNKIILGKDNSVSREKHVWIIYEPKHREFFIQPGEGSGLSYLNGENIMTATKLKEKDALEFGEGMYLLIPLCGEDFSWEEYIK